MVAISRAGSSIFVKTESLSMLGLQKKIAFGVRRTLKALPQKRTDTISSSSASSAFSLSSHPWWFVDPQQNQFLNAVSPFNPRKNKKKNNLQFSFQHLKGGVFINSHGGRSPESASALTTPTLSTFGSRESPGSLDRPTEPKECSRLRDSRGSGPPSQLDFLDIYGENMVSTPKSLPTHQFWWDMTRKVWDLILW